MICCWFTYREELPAISCEDNASPTVFTSAPSVTTTTHNSTSTSHGQPISIAGPGCGPVASVAPDVGRSGTGWELELTGPPISAVGSVTYSDTDIGPSVSEVGERREAEHTVIESAVTGAFEVDIVLSGDPRIDHAVVEDAIY